MPLAVDLTLPKAQDGSQGHPKTAGLSEAYRLLNRTPSDSILVGFSGGKDSRAVLRLCLDLREKGKFRRVEAFFWYLVPGLRSVERPVEIFCRQLDVKLHMFPHFNLPKQIKHAVLMPHYSNTGNLRKLRISDMESWMRKKTGLDWIAYGHRADDSLERRGMLTKCDGFNESSRRVYPIWYWKKSDLFAFLRKRRIPMPAVRDGLRTGGFSLSTKSLLILREQAPDDYARVLEFYPFAEAQIKRKEFANAKTSSSI